MFDRKLARAETRYIERTLSKDEVVMRNKVFNNIHKGKRCFVIANGPSLKNQDLSFLKNEITIATNTIWKHPEMKHWRPTYYCNSHIEPLNNREKNLGPGFENPSIEDGLKYWKNVKTILHDSIYFIPYSGYTNNKKTGFLPEKQTYYIPSLPYPLFETIPEFPDLTHGIPGMQDSSQNAIMLAMAMGCSPIYLLGCDHDWYMNLGPEKHFFDGPAIGEGTKIESDSSKTDMLGNMWFAWVLWRGHVNLRDIAEKNGVEIINATGGGVLDVYKKARYEDIVSKK